ncbi:MULTISPECIES: RidA family protein [Cysteiniphilum]|uniref:Reactive intermediate/imine deaminase n=1 Tax=Cysteiniphilum litorale TaxID=2056700 RepID=A0A8J2Z2N3_9GAMM|nr:MULTISPECIES: RidA family protein [Cysteiniphilum]GGF89660.1 reactive intermediate/imine deaminase [Cysteiniphilum litorale]
MKEVVQTNNAPQAIGPYVQAVKINGMLYTSGQIALNSNGELVQGDIKVQAKQVMQNLKAVVEAAGSSMDTLIKTTCFIKNMDDFVAFNEVYASFFQGITPPARSCVEVARLPKDVLIEVEAIAEI